jgi:hypothetical protein
MLEARERRPLEQNERNVLKCTDVPLNASVQWYIGHLECIDFGDPRNMPNVPVIPQLGNVPVMYHTFLYRNVYVYWSRPGLLFCVTHREGKTAKCPSFVGLCTRVFCSSCGHRRCKLAQGGRRQLGSVEQHSPLQTASIQAQHRGRASNAIIASMACEPFYGVGLIEEFVFGSCCASDCRHATLKAHQKSQFARVQKEFDLLWGSHACCAALPAGICCVCHGKLNGWGLGFLQIKYAAAFIMHI